MAKKGAKKQVVIASVKVKHDPHKIKPMDPHHSDTKYIGFEPVFDTTPVEFRQAKLAKSLNWYGRFYDQKDAKKAMVQYLEFNHRHDDARRINKLDEKAFRATLCWLARMTLRGWELNADETTCLEKDVQHLISLGKLLVKNKTETDSSSTVGSNSPNVQERMRAKAAEAGGELEGMLDAYIAAGAKANHNLKPIEELSKKNVMVQHISPLVDAWKKKEDEFTEALKGKDAQLVEGYRRFSRTQMKNLISFTGTVLSDLNAYVSVKKASKAPRKRKVIPVEKIVRRLKHVMVFKDPANNLDLIGMSPVKLHGAAEAYLYDTKKRKLIYLVADAYSKCLSVKGSTILGFDTKDSQKKSIRRPKEQLIEFLKLGRPAMRKYIDAIRAVSVTPNGRTNKDMIILKTG